MHARNSAEHAGNVPNQADAPVDRLIVREQATADSQTSDGLWCKMKQGTHIMSMIAICSGFTLSTMRRNVVKKGRSRTASDPLLTTGDTSKSNGGRIRKQPHRCSPITAQRSFRFSTILRRVDTVSSLHMFTVCRCYAQESKIQRRCATFSFVLAENPMRNHCYGGRNTFRRRCTMVHSRIPHA